MNDVERFLTVNERYMLYWLADRLEQSPELILACAASNGLREWFDIQRSQDDQQATEVSTKAA